MTNIDWDQLDHDRLQKNVLKMNPKHLGQRFTDFLAKDCLAVSEPRSVLQLTRMSAFDPKKWSPSNFGAGVAWKGELSGDGLSGDELVDASDSFKSSFRLESLYLARPSALAGEQLTGRKEFGRLKAEFWGLLGARTAVSFWQDYKKHGVFSCLEYLRQKEKIFRLQFYGHVLRCDSATPVVPVLEYDEDDNEWYRLFVSLNNVAKDPIARLSRS